MVYLYIDMDGNVGKSTDPPTEEDTHEVNIGSLRVVRISLDSYGNAFPELFDPELPDEPWFDVPKTTIETTDFGDEYHYVPM